MLSRWAGKGENLKGLKAQESIRPRLGLTLRAAMRGSAFLGGESRWSAGARPNGFAKKRKSGKGVEKFTSDPWKGEKL